MVSQAVERALKLLEVISSRAYGVERETIRQLVPGYGLLETSSAFERAFERDKQALRALGMSLSVEREPSAESGYLYRIDRQGSAVESTFSPVDIAVLNHCARAWEGTELERLAHSALLKLGTFTGHRGESELGEPARFTSYPGLADCLASIAEGKAVSFEYGMTASRRKVFCWGLGIRYGHWYITGWDADRRGQRSFRLDRMREIKVLALDGPLPPAHFSMVGVLAQLGGADIPHVATTLQNRANGNTLDAEVQLAPSFGVVESARHAIAQGRTHAVGEVAETYQEKMDSHYQAEVARVEKNLRDQLVSWHSNTPLITPPSSRKAWKPIAPQRLRESVSEQLMRMLLMVYLVSEKGGMYLDDLADFFGIPAKKALSELENMTYGLEYDSLTVEVSADGFVTVGGSSVITSGVALTETEYLILGLALDLAASTGESGLYRLLKFKLWSAASQGKGENRGRALSERVAVYPADFDDELAYALEHRVPLDISYRSRRGITDRVIEPVSLVIDNGPKYVKAWCRTAREFRNFSLASILRSRLMMGQSFEHRPQDTGTSPHQWLQGLMESRGSAESVTLALPISTAPGAREKLRSVLGRYASESAETSEWLFYRVRVIHESWFFDLMVELGPSVYVVSSEKMRTDFLEHITLVPNHAG